MSAFYTVSQYAELTGKDVGNIRRMLIQGKIKGEKLGNQWIIPKDAVYPEDRRVKTGNYRNWRKRSEVLKTNPDLMKDLSKMCTQLTDVYGDFLYRIILYGSYARGEQTNESDVDIALFLKSGNTEDMHDAMTDIVVDHELDQGVTLSVVPIECEQYEKWRKVSPFFQNIDKEGITLWKAV